MIEFTLGFVVGSVVTASSLLAIGYYFLQRDAKKVKELIAKANKQQADLDEKYKTVKPRLDRAADISARQLDIMAAVDMPSKNALHSQHKNALIAEIKELEKEKRSILHSIIDDGFDPNLTVTAEDGTKEVITLSEYMARQGILHEKQNQPKEEPIEREVLKEEKGKTPQITKKGKFIVIKGGKNDTTH